MCGRFVSTTGASVLAAHFGAETIVGDVPSRWNIAPTAQVWVVRQHDRSRVLETMRWGLVPSWADDPAVGNRMFNARAETLTQRPAYRSAARKRRCVVPADGFYEWAAVPGSRRKQAWYFHHADDSPLAMAGLWEVWQPGPDGAGALHTCTVVTTEADAVVSPIHHRMPAILAGDAINQWLSHDTSHPDDVEAVLSTTRPPSLVSHPVGIEVNNARSDGPGLLTARADARQGPGSGDDPHPP
jgi:putative SOS response-associated peptidase YedK